MVGPVSPRIPNGATVIKPQPGPQTQFMTTPADIAIYGGAAGGGKSFALLLDPLRDIDVGDFSAVFFRRNTVQVRAPGGLWDTSAQLYQHVRGAEPVSHVLEWRFPSGARIKFSHLEYDKNKTDWQGAQIPLIAFDELTHFTEGQFWYLLSRNRSACGVAPRVRATCNPDADSWVAKLISWWIDPNSGLPIPERSGALRWFVRVGDSLKWADSPDGLSEYRTPDGSPIPPKSLTFIPAKLTDNQALMRADPAYMANLMSLPSVDRERLLGGNWKIRASAGLLFQRRWCEIIDVAPAELEVVRGWDVAATPKTEDNDPDATASVKIGKTPGGTYVVLDAMRFQAGPAERDTLILNTASHDGMAVRQSLPQDPGAAGKSQAQAWVKMLAGYSVTTSVETGDKVTRFSPFSAQAEHGNVKVLRGDWNDDWFAALENFPPETGHDDEADATSRAFNAFLSPVAGGALLELARRRLANRDAPAAAPEPTYAVGSLEWAKQQAAKNGG
jgi:predicted phage terminase large subunit-like protein